MNLPFINVIPNDNVINQYMKIFSTTDPISNIYKIAVIIDIVLVVVLIHYILTTIKNTRVLQLFKGIGLLLIANYISYILKMPILHSILSSITTYGTIMLVIIFQPEIRKMLEQLRNK